MTKAVGSDKLTVFSIQGPKTGQRSLESLAGRGLKRQLIGCDVIELRAKNSFPLAMGFLNSTGLVITLCPP